MQCLIGFDAAQFNFLLKKICLSYSKCRYGWFQLTGWLAEQVAGNVLHLLYVLQNPVAVDSKITKAATQICFVSCV